MDQLGDIGSLLVLLPVCHDDKDNDVQVDTVVTDGRRDGGDDARGVTETTALDVVASMKRFRQRCELMTNAIPCTLR